MYKYFIVNVRRFYMDNLKKLLSAKEKSIYMRALLYVLTYGKRLTKENQEYLLKQAEETGAKPEVIKEFQKFKSPEELGQLICTIKSIRTRRFILREMVMLAVADHEISDKEMTDIYMAGTTAGIKEDKINDFFLWAAEGIDWQIRGMHLITEDL